MSIQTTDRCFSLADNPLKIHVVVNGKLHKKSIIKKYNLTFPNRRLIHEDEYWAWIYGIYCNKCIYLSKGLYHYRIHPNSITRTEENTPNSLDIIDIDTLIAKFLQQKELLSKYIYLSNHNIEENINFLVTLPQEIGNKAYLRNFLIDNNICFYENITLGEDELFNLQCLLHAKSYTILKEHLQNL